ncbi:MAG: glycosyltransferase [Oscillospiraceae bacterium]
MKVAILTMFNGLSNTYSLVNVVAEHLKMLLSDNIEVKVLVSENCPDSERSEIFADKRIEWVKIINQENGEFFHWKTYKNANDEIEKSFFHQAELITQDFVKHLSDVDICIMHDILYQGVHLIHNVAIREAQKKLPRVKFVAFTHSAPTKHIEAPYPISCMFSEMPNTTFVYPTESGLLALAAQYNTDISSCACVNNSVDIMLGMSEEAREVGKYMDFTHKDILIVYPARLTLSKRFHIIAELAGYIKTFCHQSVGIVFCDFSCSDIKPETYKHIIKELGIRNGLSSEDILFTSDCGFKNGVKRETVFSLFSISNLFICPSYSESFGLTVIEAASRGNYIVLNEAVPALEEIGKNIGAYFMRWSAKNFGFDTNETYHPSEKMYYIENAKNIIENMISNPVIKAKTLSRIRYSNKWIYENQLKPLLNDVF